MDNNVHDNAKILQTPQSNSKKTKANPLVLMASTALLIAIGILIPLIMPFPLQFSFGPASYTLASHVAIFLSMFISPFSSLAVAVGTTIGFAFKLPPAVAVRAGTHIVWALLGSYFLTKVPSTLDSFGKSQLFSFIIGLVHGFLEAIAVMFLFFGGVVKYANNINPVTVIVLLVGVASVVHSMVDFSIAYFIRKALRSNREIKKIFI